MRRAALMPPGYYALIVPALLRQDRHELPATRRTELDKFGAAARTRPELRGMVQALFDALLPRGRSGQGNGRRSWNCSRPTDSTEPSTNKSARTSRGAHRTGPEPPSFGRGD